MIAGDPDITEGVARLVLALVLAGFVLSLIVSFVEYHHGVDDQYNSRRAHARLMHEISRHRDEQ